VISKMATFYNICCARCENIYPFYNNKKDFKFKNNCYICESEMKNIAKIEKRNFRQIKRIKNISDTQDRNLWTLGTRYKSSCCCCKNKRPWYNLDFDLKNFFVFAPHPSHIFCKHCFSEKLESYDKIELCECGLDSCFEYQKLRRKHK